ncbi:LacI family DNA-binding transcriptional regulator [Paenibacillus sp. GCM10027626]|uniref:LacI family DNA-binding transcriptional regulator n=1 Tax=Paenibacillus sp. GCM10027626 TaxID=3273411 RepID=UPI00363720C5
MITMKDVAKLAGVSPITVSRVISSPEQVRPATQAKVMKAIEELNFKPNNIARSLVTNRTDTIGLLLSNIANPYYPEFILGLETYARAQGKNVIICNAQDYDTASHNLELLLEKRVDGIVITSIEFASMKLQEKFHAELEDLVHMKQKSIPIVLMDPNPRSTLLSCVEVDNYLAGRIAMDHLHSLGHRRIAHLSVERDANVWIDRMRAFKDAYRRYGLDLQQELVELIETEDVRAAAAAATRLLQCTPRPTAIFAGNDLLAIGALHAAHRLGIRVPEQLSIIGIDGINVGDQIYPRLTTVAHPQSKVGEVAAQLLLDKINGNDDNSSIILKPALLVRESTAAVEKL